MIITSRWKENARGLESKQGRGGEGSFDVFSLDLLQAERQILRYSSDEKLLLAGASSRFSL